MSDKNAHILNTSSNLLGLCIVVVSVTHSTKITNLVRIDKFAMIAALFFMGSCFLSFLSIKSRSFKRSYRYELIADGLFFLGLLVLCVSVGLVAFDFIA